MLCVRPAINTDPLPVSMIGTRFLHMTKISGRKWPKSAGYCTSNDVRALQKYIQNCAGALKLKLADVNKFLVFHHYRSEKHLRCEPELFETF